jgi:hypothetical protein
MKFALQELGEHIAENDAAGEYQRTLYRTLAANNPHGPTLLDWNEIDLRLARSATAVVGPILMDRANSGVKKYRICLPHEIAA